MTVIIAAIAEPERNLTVERVRAAMRRAKQGSAQLFFNSAALVVGPNEKDADFQNKSMLLATHLAERRRETGLDRKPLENTPSPSAATMSQPELTFWPSDG